LPARALGAARSASNAASNAASREALFILISPSVVVRRDNIVAAPRGAVNSQI
jgi:hypothetical protein